MQGTDAELVARVLAGDREAFAELVERHSPALWQAVRGALSDRERGRDVFQEAWLRAFVSLHTLHAPDRFRSWLLSIALNLTKQWSRRSEPRGVPSEAEQASSSDLPTRPEHEELSAVLVEAVASLPPRQREVVHLRIHFERSYAEIGIELGTSEESARASFYQAMRRLRARFGPRLDEWDQQA